MNEVKKAVVVDDDLKVTVLLEKVLSEQGFQVFTTHDGKKALALVESEKPDVLITDILIPGMDGISLCQTIKSDPMLEDIVVIVMTGIYKQASFKAEMKCKPDGFIEKPLDVKQLKSLVLEKLGIE